jgi:predicted CopG family antitoxin
MAMKTITVTAEAYERLAAFKGDDESFSETLLRLTDAGGDPMEMVGAWAGTDYAEAAEAGIDEFDESMVDRHDALIGE